jgi:hypothetical protein
VKIARTAKGLVHVNRLVLRRATIYFQLHPGKHGEASTRGVAGIDYVVRVGDAIVDRGTSDADGAISLWLPPGQRVELEALGTRYQVVFEEALDDVAEVKGYQARLSLLGYELGDIDGDHQARTERAMMNFVADQGLDPDQRFSAHERARLVAEVGE